MKHIGIIAEYNPFHNGHAYQLKKVKKLYPEKNILVLMSGNYVQRGEPAVFNKYLRAQCALQAGADIVFELPLIYATSSAEYFASAAVMAFHKLGVIDTLCFGAETDNLPLLQEIAHILVTEPASYKTLLQQELKNGNSFPKSRMLAIATYLEKEETKFLLQQPNNILAIEYLKAIERYHIDITPVIIKRIGKGYHDTDRSDTFCSATAIRLGLKASDKDFSASIPPNALRILQDSKYAKPIFAEDFYPSIQYALWREKAHLEQYLDVSEDLAKQIRSILQHPKTLDILVDMLSSKNYTATRIKRILLNILLDIRASDMDDRKHSDFVTYLRLLGFHKNTSFILKDMKDNTTIPIINKVANAKTILSPKDYTYFSKELHQNHLYKQIFFNKYGITIPSEYEHSVIISE